MKISIPMDTRLEEVTVPEAKLASSVPEEYQKYEGYYVTTAGLVEITFPEMKYMLVKYLAETTSEEYFAYSDLGFVRVKGDVASWNVKQDINFAAVSMEEKEPHRKNRYKNLQKTETIIGEKKYDYKVH